MSTATAASGRAIAWARRRRALGRFASQYRRKTGGLVGLGLLAFFGLMALLAPVLADRETLSAVNTIENPVWASPAEFAPMGTDQLGRPSGRSSSSARASACWSASRPR